MYPNSLWHFCTSKDTLPGNFTEYKSVWYVKILNSISSALDNPFIKVFKLFLNIHYNFRFVSLKYGKERNYITSKLETENQMYYPYDLKQAKHSWNGNHESLYRATRVTPWPTLFSVCTKMTDLELEEILRTSLKTTFHWSVYFYCNFCRNLKVVIVLWFLWYSMYQVCNMAINMHIRSRCFNRNIIGAFF